MTDRQSSTHTPGPWHVDDESYNSIRGAGLTIALVQGDTIGEIAANARLMAAAPELLDALRDCTEHLDSLVALNPKARVAIVSARAAIEKATDGS